MTDNIQRNNIGDHAPPDATSAAIDCDGEVSMHASSDNQKIGATNNQPEKLRLHTFDDLKKLPRPTWLIKGILPVDAHAAIVGKPKSFKSFLALDFALCIATGTPWQGRKVKKAPVVYIAAEGGLAFRQRIEAWMKEHQKQSLGDAYFIREPLHLLEDEDVKTLFTRLDHANLKPGLIVLDTFARCFGGDENSSQETGKAIQALDRIRQATGATTLYVHHTPRKSKAPTPRGSSALEGAADMMLTVNRAGNSFVLHADVEKQKDAEEVKDIRLKLKSVEVGTDEDGKTITSLVVVPKDHLEIGTEEAVQADAGISELSTSHKTALSALLELGGEAQFKVWRTKTSEGLGKDVSKKTFANWRDDLRDDYGLVFSPEGKHGVWVLTDEGAATAKKLPSAGNGKLPTSSPAANATPPVKGVAWQKGGLLLEDDIPLVYDPTNYPEAPALDDDYDGPVN